MNNRIWLAIGAVGYVATIFLVVYHNTGYDAAQLTRPRYFVPLLMGAVGLVAILYIVRQALRDDEQPPK